MLVQALYNVVDRIFLGAGVNQMSIGGVYLMFPIFLFLMAFGMLIGVGGNSLSSIKFGEGKKKESENHSWYFDGSIYYFWGFDIRDFSFKFKMVFENFRRK